MRTARHSRDRLPALLLLLASTLGAFAQTAPATYWVQFTDKDHTPYSLDAPEAFLSPRALERRARQHIPLDTLDLPVDPAYIAALLEAGDIELIARSKWSNAVTIRTTDTLALDTLGLLPFVNAVRMLHDGRPRPPRASDKLEGLEKDYADTYGTSLRQIAMMNGHLLHTIGGAQGQGMLIGVLDAGFAQVDVMPAFAALRERNAIRLARDIVQPGGNVYTEGAHGRAVLSVMAGELDGRLLGTAPLADYVLLRTENADSEYLMEEDAWVSGAELCDSIGCDVLNTSLGYTVFDDSTQDHTYADLDGRTTRISIAAGIAAQKGMLPVNSAGNSGSNDWHYIGAPADAYGILVVGAVDNDRHLADFSSRGPSADGRIKPDVAAVGLGTIGVDDGGQGVASINGTSFSSPLVAGLTACLWQLHRDRTNEEIIEAIRRSASQADRPDNDLGYGIPDFWRAHLLLGGRDLTGLRTDVVLDILPVPFTTFFDVELFAGGASQLELALFDVSGRRVWASSSPLEPGTYGRIRVQDGVLSHLRAGAYVVDVRAGDARLTRRVIKAE